MVGKREKLQSPGLPRSLVIAVIGKSKTSPLMNADNTDRKRAVQFPNLAVSAILAIMVRYFAGEGALRSTIATKK
jgi:hypothetical protein